MDATHATRCKATQAAIAEGRVPTGWRPDAWAARLRQLADACRALHPERAADLVAWATAVERAQGADVCPPHE